MTEPKLNYIGPLPQALTYDRKVPLASDSNRLSYGCRAAYLDGRGLFLADRIAALCV